MHARMQYIQYLEIKHTNIKKNATMTVIAEFQDHIVALTNYIIMIATQIYTLTSKVLYM